EGTLPQEKHLIMSNFKSGIHYFSLADFSTTLIAIMLLTCLTTTAYSETTATDQLSNPTKATNKIEDIGIRVDNIRLTAANYMLDFRYTVTDPEKAAKVINRKIKPVLIDNASGIKMTVPSTPKTGALRHTGHKLKADRSYFALFANPGQLIKSGSKVTVVFDDVRLEDLIVE
ncbi:MAG: hypothetical protein QGG39_17495, partial [Candidatus Poribacteria bacterium]|nr:hypothetical protein [Candidatus Poribacteria bacterium]